MTQLLVSVRNAAEAEAALRGGARLIDVKEPANGPLGKADDAAIAEVVRAVDGRADVSAALGDIPIDNERATEQVVDGLAYVKFGLAGHDRRTWRDRVAGSLPGLSQRYPGALAVVAAYADWRLAGSPPPDDICDFAMQQDRGVFLIDTFAKAWGKTLLDCLPLSEITRLCDRCRSAGLRVALAGSLTREQVATLLPLRPDWIAVRGAACDGGRRGVVSEQRVGQLVALLTGGSCGS